MYWTRSAPDAHMDSLVTMAEQKETREEIKMSLQQQLSSLPHSTVV